MTPLHIYRALFGISIVSNVGIALACVFVPDWFAYLVIGHWDHAWLGWMRAWGATLLGLHMVYLPGLVDPIDVRWPNWSSIAIKFMMPAVFFSNPLGFEMFGAWDLAWGVVLLVAYAYLLLNRKDTP
jgi:hypothetical protein